MNRNISTTKKLLISSFYSIVYFNFISLNSYKNSRKMPIEKFIFRLETCNFTKTEPFCRYSCIIPIIQDYLQNVDFSYLFSKFSLASPRSCFQSQFIIIVNEIICRKITFYLRSFTTLISFIFFIYINLLLLCNFHPSKRNAMMIGRQLG